MKAKIWTLVFTVILFAAVSGCGKTAAQETEITQQASLEAADKAFCEAGAAQAESFFKTGVASCPVLHSYGPYPSYYLDDGAPLLSFWADAQAETDCALALLFQRLNGALSYQVLSVEEGTFYARFLRLEQTGDGSVTASGFERHPVQEWNLTQNGNFYYRLFPAGDKHYADFQLIRTNAPDEALFAALERYVLPIDYYYVNLLITDWSEPSFEGMSFNDLFDRLYALQTGEQPDSSRYLQDDAGLFRIPAAEFEAVVLPYFDLSPEALHALAGFDAQTESYPWCPIETNDMERYDYPAVEPYITQILENADGTKTLLVSCLSTDIPTDCLFSHELTVRDLPDGGFQFVSNRVTFQTGLGLPNDAPRLRAK